MKSNADSPPKAIRRLTLLLSVAFISATANAFNSHSPFDIAADLIDYQDADQRITAEGHVVVVQSSSTLHADFVTYDRIHQRLVARGNVVLHEKGGVLAGELMDYDLVAEAGNVQQAKAYGAPWLLQGNSWEKIQDYYVGRMASFTSCELIDPHYHFRSARLHVVPDQVFWAWNNRVFIDKVPTFYTPFLYKWLGPRRVVFQAQPGHDEVNGSFARTKTTIRLAPLVYDRVLFDHYTNSGNGFGNELFYQEGNRLKGTLFGYYINPHGNPELFGAPKAPQFNIRSYHYQALKNNVTLQSSVNIRNNVSFNNQYFREDTNQTQIDLPSSVALTKQTKRLNQRLVAERFDAPDSGDTSLFAQTHLQSASFPRYEFTLYEAPLFKKKESISGASVSSSSGTTPLVLRRPNRIGPLMLSASGSLGESYLRTDQKNRTSGNGQFSLTESFLLSDRWTFGAGISPQLSWKDKAAPGDVDRGFQGRLSTSENLRYRASSSLTWDGGYQLTERLTPNGMRLDRRLSDGGIETHHLTTAVNWRPSRSILLRSSSGFDLRRLADEAPATYRQRRWDSWLTELTLQPKRSAWDLFFRYSLSHAPERVGLWEGTYRYGGLHRTVLETGLLYNRGLPGLLTWNNRIGLYVSPSWRVDTTIHALVPNSNFHNATSNGSLIDSEFSVVRDMHCWEAQFTYRNLPPFAREYSIIFNLKLGARGEKEIRNDALESQFYSWRAPTTDRKPLFQPQN